MASTSSSTPSSPVLDVLIVGAGPVGLLAASELASRGCTVRIVDLEPVPVRLTKASGIMERSMEILPEPVANSILKTSKHVQCARMFEHDGQGEGKVISSIQMLSEKRGGKGLRSQPQWMTERALNEYLESLDVQVERPVELVGFQEVKRGVACRLRHHTTQDIETVEAKFLLGCDGGRSPIRKGLGLKFDGDTTAEYFFALHAQLSGYVGNDTSVDMYFSKDSSNVGSSKDTDHSDTLAPGFGFAMPMPDGGYLLIVDLDQAQQSHWRTGKYNKYGYELLRQPSPEEVVHVLKQRGCGQNLAVVEGTVQWVAHFRVNSRQASHYGKGRVFLAGDACHCHSPLGGQGMNMGFNDAKNLAWKLAAVAKGAMPMRILRSYEEERHPIEQKILTAIEEAQKVVSSRNPVIFFMRGRGQRLAPVLINFALQHTDGHILQYGTQQAWTYAASSLSLEHWERPLPSWSSPFRGLWTRKNQNLFRWLSSRVHAGDTVPEAKVGNTSVHTVLKRSTGWTLLLFEGNQADNLLLQKHTPNVKILSTRQLEDLAKSLLASADPSGYVGGIDDYLVVPGDERHRKVLQIFGVKAQCLFLVRPDFHVGLRSEPLRKDMVLKYFHQQCGVELKGAVEGYSVPESTTTHDLLPSMIYGGLLAVTLGYGVYTGTLKSNWYLRALAGVSAGALFVLNRISRRPRGYNP